MPSGHIVWVSGATGLVGRAVVDELVRLATVERVVAIVRRPLDASDPKLESRVVSYDALERSLEGGSCSLAIGCLGTTIKQAGSREAFRKVDHDYVLAFARAAKAAGAKRLVVVTAAFANPRSLSFYSRVKGEVEAELRTLGFESLVLVRPSLLLGERAETRIAEQLAAPFSRLLPPSVRGIEGTTVARAVVRLAVDERAGGVRVVNSAELHDLGR